MQVSVSDAKAQLTDLVRRAETGEDVVLTRHGQPTVRLVPVQRKPTAEEKRAVLEQFRGILKGRPGLDGVTAANIADDLYDENGLPV